MRTNKQTNANAKAAPACSQVSALLRGDGGDACLLGSAEEEMLDLLVQLEPLRRPTALKSDSVKSPNRSCVGLATLPALRGGRVEQKLAQPACQLWNRRASVERTTPAP